ncbi:hypothetical protein HDU67_009606 [Dinochytrium kinnereticum]|nr:hypothetical protein HDU67_009606 [Dinochytrium kinnereticum]
MLPRSKKSVTNESLLQQQKHRQKPHMKRSAAVTKPTQNTSTMTKIPRKSIGEMLAELSNPSPDTVFDPDRHGEDQFRLGTGFVEDGGTDAIAEARAKERMEAAAREHYVEVGVGKLRRDAGVTMDEKKYAGKRVSRKALGFDEEEEDSDVEFDGENGFDDDEDEEDEEDEEEEIVKAAKSRRVVKKDVKSKLAQRQGTIVEDMRDTEEENFDGIDDEEDDEDDESGEFEFDGDDQDDDDEDDEGDDDEEDDEDEDDEDDDGEEDEDDGYDMVRSKEQNSKIEAELQKLAEEEKKLVSTMSQSAKADLEKGYHVRSQMLVWDNLLDVRMHFQKALAIANTLPKFDAYPLFFMGPTPGLDDVDATHLQTRETLTSNVETATQSVAGLLEDLLKLRATIAARNETVVTTPKDFADSLLAKLGGKRKRDDDGAEEDAKGKKSKKRVNPTAHFDLTNPFKAWEEIDAFDKAFQPFRDATIEKWSGKVSAASSGASLVSSGKKFKAINTSVLSQIKTVLMDRERLTKRTQLVRDGANAKKALGVLPKPAEFVKAFEKKEGEEEAEAVGGKLDAQLAQYDTEIFDDGDFYQQLLKELIETRMGDVDDPMILGMKFAELKKLQSKKKKKQVDIRASKGRKLRYHVHEKIQNFMAPEPRGTWHEEMVDELFSSLFGGSGRVSTGANGEGGVAQDVQGEETEIRDGEIAMPSDGLRVFG